MTSPRTSARIHGGGGVIPISRGSSRYSLRAATCSRTWFHSNRPPNQIAAKTEPSTIKRWRATAVRHSDLPKRIHGESLASEVFKVVMTRSRG